MDGVEATQHILTRLPSTRVIALSASHTPEHIYRVLRAGAHAYLVKDAVSSELVPVIHKVHAGHYHLSPGIDPLILASALNEFARRTPMETLSKREREVLRWIVAGATSTEIGLRMVLSPKTIDTYRSRMMVKLGVANRSALIRFAIEHEPIAK
jgi:DNA-binding NarL/FixJ family response regulator